MSFFLIAGGEQAAHYQFVERTKAPYEIREAAPFSTPVKSFIFDFGGVLVKPDEELLIAYLSDFFAVPPDEIRKLQVKELEWIRVNDTEFSFWQDFANQVGKELPPDWRERYAEVKFESVRELPQIGELLEEIQQEGYSLAMLSNFEPWMEPLLDRFQYRGKFTLYLSYQTQKAKPSPDAYEAVLNGLGLQSSQVIFIDNQLNNVETARNLGIDAVHFTSTQELREALVERHILRD